MTTSLTGDSRDAVGLHRSHSWYNEWPLACHILDVVIQTPFFQVVVKGNAAGRAERRRCVDSEEVLPDVGSSRGLKSTAIVPNKPVPDIKRT